MAKENSSSEINRALLSIESCDGKIRSQLRKKWLVETPEERVRQEYLCVLVNEYGFSLDQMAEELEITGRGSGHARADFVIWRTIEDKNDQKSPLIVVECKSDNVTIRSEDYWQGDHYARVVNARFVVTHNNRETRYWRVLHERMPKTLEEIENIPHANASDKEIEELISSLKVFKEDEFAELLHQCHNIIRNREKKDPAAAFDEIAKVLFMKVFVERELAEKKRRKNVFSVDYLREQIGDDPIQDLFAATKRAYKADQIFDPGEQINLKPATTEEIVRRLERYNLSDTSEDIKGIAFERFLGRTFRGEIGQFFTPRSIVEFMIRMVDPQEGEVICDPASGSGGFLIRFFELVREQILADADQEYQQFRADIEAQSDYSETEKAKLLRQKFDSIQLAVDHRQKNSRLWKLANRCIYGMDANDRMARTSKMNMIMHGDGHGGVHHHDGFLNINDVFDGRFDIVLTNPPFGASVEPSEVIVETDLMPSERGLDERYLDAYGDVYAQAQARVRAALGRPILSLFELPKNAESKVKTEILFLERCLELLKPGGRLGMVLPEGVLNNPSLAYVREFCEDRAFIRAVVSLPQETFYSAGAAVKASILFMQKFDAEEKVVYNTTREAAIGEVEAKYATNIARETNRLETAIVAAKKARDAETRKALQKELRDYLKLMDTLKKAEARSLLKARFAYPIFLYEAAHVGITSTGDPDLNELYPNERVPTSVDKTCLEMYRAFQKHSSEFLPKQRQPEAAQEAGVVMLPPTPRKGAFALAWQDFERWDTFFYREDFVELEKQLLSKRHARLGDVLNFISRPWRPEYFSNDTFEYVEISSVTREDGITTSRSVNIDEAPSRATTWIRQGDVILATTRPYLGAFAIVPPQFDGCVCSSGFALADGLKTNEIMLDFLLFFLKSAAGLRQMERRMTGGLYPAIIQSELEKIIVPLPSKSTQTTVVQQVKSHQEQIARERAAAERRIREIESQIEAMILGTRPVD